MVPTVLPPATPTTFNFNLPAGTVPTPAPSPTATPAPAGPTTVSIPLTDLQAFTAAQARLSQMEADNRQRELASQQREAQLLADTGKVQEALVLLRKQSDEQVNAERLSKAQVEERAKRYALDGELARTLASQPLVPGGAEQLTQLWRNQFAVEPQGDTYAVRTPTFESVEAFVTRNLAQPNYAHFVRAQNPTGGTGAPQGGALSTPTPAANILSDAPVQPRNLGEALLLQMKENARKPIGSSATDVGQSFGLRRTS